MFSLMGSNVDVECNVDGHKYQTNDSTPFCLYFYILQCCIKEPLKMVTSILFCECKSPTQFT